MVKDALRLIIGKRISAVIAKEGKAPAWQLYLVFDDDTYYEVYGSGDLQSAGGVDPGGLNAARRYCHQSHKIVFEAAFDDSELEGADVN